MNREEEKSCTATPAFKSRQWLSWSGETGAESKSWGRNHATLLCPGQTPIGAPRPFWGTTVQMGREKLESIYRRATGMETSPSGTEKDLSMLNLQERSLRGDVGTPPPPDIRRGHTEEASSAIPKGRARTTAKSTRTGAPARRLDCTSSHPWRRLLCGWQVSITGSCPPM